MKTLRKIIDEANDNTTIAVEFEHDPGVEYLIVDFGDEILAIHNGCGVSVEDWVLAKKI